MSEDDKAMAADTLRILHGARSLPPARAAKALEPFLESMAHKNRSGAKLGNASADAVLALARSLRETNEASDDLWQEAIDATLSYANEEGTI
jgi:hypothetical protein